MHYHHLLFKRGHIFMSINHHLIIFLEFTLKYRYNLGSHQRLSQPLESSIMDLLNIRLIRNNSNVKDLKSTFIVCFDWNKLESTILKSVWKLIQVSGQNVHFTCFTY